MQLHENADMKAITVGAYLGERLKQLGVNHLFSVPGDYTSDLLEIIDTQGLVQRIGNCNELNAGYAADGYARANGLGAVAITTGVGSFSVLNAIGGAYVEQVPVVLIIGTLSNAKLATETAAGILYHHNVGIADQNLIFNTVTVAYERITDPLNAPAQIDRALTACISNSKPVAIEIMEDCYYMPCAAPQGSLQPMPTYTDFATLKQMADASPANKYAMQIVASVISAATAITAAILKAKMPVFWVGHEVRQYGLQQQMLALLELTGAPWVSSIAGKAVLPENLPGYCGIYEGAFTSKATQSILDASDCIIAVGVLNTDLNTFSPKPNPAPGNPANIIATRGIVRIGTDDYINVTLENLLNQILDSYAKKGAGSKKHKLPAKHRHSFAPGDTIKYDSFFANLDDFLQGAADYFLVADVGLSTFGGSSSLSIYAEDSFMVQSLWASIGWSVPAGLGASFTDGKRAIVIVGDGAFKLTCQEISTMVMEGRNTVVFVLNNTVYGVEQMLLNPAPYEAGSSAPFEAANVLQAWDYVSLMKAFSNNSDNAMSASVRTVEDMQGTLQHIAATPHAAWLVSINLDSRDYPSSWSAFVPSK